MTENDEKKPLRGAPIRLGSRGKPVTIYMTPAQHEKLKRLGGSAWIRKQIDSAEEK